MSLRARLLVVVAVIAAVVLATAVVITRTTRDHLVAQVDRQLREARVPAQGLGVGGDFGRPFPLDDTNRGFRSPPPSRFSEFWVLRLTDGVLYAGEPDATDDPAPQPDLTVEQVEAAVDGEPFTIGSQGSDLRYRALATELNGAKIVVALPLGDVDETVDRLVVVEVVTAAVVLAVLGLALWWVIRLGVRPIKRMTQTATAIAAGDLSHRVPEGASGTEAAALGTALNQMLGTIEESFQRRVESEARLRQFVADASHELRTPVATIRGYAELYRVGGLVERPSLDDAMRRTESEAVRMASLVDDLLALARLDAGRPLERQRVALDHVVDDVVRDARAVDPGRPITTSRSGPAAVMGDERRLRQVLTNLVGNAMVHTPPGSAVDVRVRADAAQVVVEVADEGQGMTPEVADRIFERFYRADPARSRHQGGSGLGLAIVQGTVAAHGGTVVVDTAPGRGTTMRVELPLAPPGSVRR